VGGIAYLDPNLHVKPTAYYEYFIKYLTDQLGYVVGTSMLPVLLARDGAWPATSGRWLKWKTRETFVC
jgi:hypothetical protein